MSLTVHGAGPSLNSFLHSAPLDRCRRHLEDSIFRSLPLKLWQERFPSPLQCRTKSSSSEGCARQHCGEPCQHLLSECSRGLFSSLNGNIESKKSAEWSNVINDEKREWTNSPNSQNS